MRKSVFVYVKIKAQISFAVTLQLIRAFVSTIPFQASTLAIFCGCTSHKVGNHEDRFSHDAVLMSTTI